MDWLIALRESLPLILILSPVVGFLATSIVARVDPASVRPIGIANSICTLLILMGVVWQFERDRYEEATARTLSSFELGDSHSTKAEQAALDRQVDKARTDRLARQWFVVDGINLWSIVVLILLSSALVWRTKTVIGQSPWFVPSLLLYEAASISALTAYDLRAYLVAIEMAIVSMSVMLGLLGGPDRRTNASRLLTVQHGGLFFLILGFAMLVPAVPWMKIEDSSKIPTYSFHIATIVYELQKWMSSNQLSFHYVTTVFPLVLLVTSLGFVIQFGLFPFHSPLLGTIEQTPQPLLVLYLVGLSAAAWTGWLRFVVSLAPEVLAGFGQLILIPSVGGALWASIRAFAPCSLRQKAASLFLSLSSLALLGCYSFSIAGLSGTWLMQQQITAAFCLVLFLFDSPNIETVDQTSAVSRLRSGYKTRSLLFLFGLSCLGFIASGYILCTDLFVEDLVLTACALASALLVLLSILSLLNRHVSVEEPAAQNGGTNSVQSFDGSLIVVVLILIIVSLFPGLMLRQCEPEFARIFRRF